MSSSRPDGELVDGRYRIVSQPPIVVPARDLAARDLSRLGVELHMGSIVTHVDSVGLEVKDHDGTVTRHLCGNVLWTAGVEAPPLAAAVAKATGAQQDRAGRTVVGKDPGAQRRNMRLTAPPPQATDRRSWPQRNLRSRHARYDQFLAISSRWGDVTGGRKMDRGGSTGRSKNSGDSGEVEAD